MNPPPAAATTKAPPSSYAHESPLHQSLSLHSSDMGSAESASTLANGHGAAHPHGKGAGNGTAALPPPAAQAQKRKRRGVGEWCKHAILNTPPSFFAMNMGTGIASILLHNFPYPAQWLRYLGTIVFVLNVVLFCVLLIATILRYTMFRGVWGHVLKHNVASMFWGCFPMGFSTIINMIIFVCVPAWGKRWAYIALGMWWAHMVVAIAVNFGMVFVLFTRQAQTPTSLAPTWLLPIVSSVVAAASGAVVASAVQEWNPALARGTLLASFVIWGTGVPLAMMVIALIVGRMGIHGPPGPDALASVYLPLGPCGQGAFGIVSMGTVARSLAYKHGTAVFAGIVDADQIKRIADAVYAGCLVTGLILWGLALVWYTLATAMFLDGLRKDWALLAVNKFSVGLWALTFPIGVFATSTIVLGQELESTAFKVIAAFLSAQVIVHWIYVSILTLAKMFAGQLFAAPEFKAIAPGVVKERFGSHNDVEFGCNKPAPPAAAGNGVVKA